MFDIVRIKYTELEKQQNTFEKIQSRNPDGIIISNFLNTAQIELVKNNVLKSTCEISTVAPYGKIIGKKLNSVSGNFQELAFDDYLKYSDSYRSYIETDTGLDFEMMLKGVFNKLNNAKAEVPAINGKSYVPLAVRILFPNKGGIIAHVGNEFINKMPEIVELQHSVNAHNQLSYFCMIQAPSRGGELVLYDATWEETAQLGLSFQETSEYVKEKNKQAVEMFEGDLIVFAGGEIWHEVTDIFGDTDRVTIGGFIAPSIDKRNWFFWS